MNILDPKIAEYIKNLNPSRKEPWVEMEAYAREIGFPIIGPLVGMFLKQMTISTGAKRIFELGSGYGYSALWMASALPDDGKIYLTDRREENHKLALKHFETAGLADKMEFFVGDAIEIFRGQNGLFDIILCDIDKQAYPETIIDVKKRLRPGGLFIADNIFHGGRIVGDNPEAGTKAILQFTRILYEDPEFLTSIIPLRDGITVAVKV